MYDFLYLVSDNVGDFFSVVDKYEFNLRRLGRKGFPAHFRDRQ